MPTSIAALTPPNQAIPHRSHDDVTPGVPEMAFSDLWQDKKEGLSFGDFLDIINPLQHIPVVSTIYRMVTGDQLGVGARLAGGALFGGPLGLMGAGIVALFENISGETVEQQVASLWNGVAGGDEPQHQVASAGSAAGSAGAVAEAPKATVAQADIAPPPTVTATAAPIPAVPAPPLPPPPVWAPPAQPATAAAKPAEPKTAPAPQPAPQPAPRADAAAERQRIAQTVQQAQRAQAALLLASIGADRMTASSPDSEDGRSSSRSDAPPPQPFRSHPYMLPPGAPPEMINRAMTRALDRYQVLLQQRNGAATPANPRPAAFPVR